VHASVSTRKEHSGEGRPGLARSVVSNRARPRPRAHIPSGHPTQSAAA
jgi:hypothetical protein